MPSLASPSSLLFHSIASHATRIPSIHARLHTSATSSLETEDLDEVETVDLHSLSSSVASSTAYSICESCAHLESGFTGAVQFVENYQGPHRVLTEPNSSFKRNLDAFFKQATVGPCPTTTPPVGQGDSELSYWKKWRELGHMTRQEAMKRYTIILDNLVDDWRRSANVSSSSMETSGDIGCDLPCGGNVATSTQLKRRSSTLCEGLPQMYAELKALQDRVEDETQKRDELETHVLHVTRDNREMFNQHVGRTEQRCSHLMTQVKRLEDSLVQHIAALQQVALQHQQLAVQTEKSVLLAIEARVQHIVVSVKIWLQKRSVRTVLVVLIGLRVWHFVRRQRLPQFLARILIHWLVKVSSLDGGEIAVQVE